MISLLKNLGTISEQFDARLRLANGLYRWAGLPPRESNIVGDVSTLDLARFQSECGICCYWSNTRVCGWLVVDEGKYVDFVLKYL